jgi:hypothetical protein
VTLAAFVYALAVAHLFSRVASLLLARNRVRFSGLQALMVSTALAEVLGSWLVTWATHGVREWGLPTILGVFVVASANYFLCAAAAPEAVAEGGIDLDAFYWRNRSLFWVTYAVLCAAQIVASIPIAQTSQAFVQGAVATLPFLSAPALALAVPARWAQWVSGLIAFAMNVGWMVVFTGSLE